MDVLGWGLFAVGGLLLFVFAFIGLDSEFGNVANLAGTLTGVATMISGAVFVAGDRIERSIKGARTVREADPVSDTQHESETKKETGIDRNEQITPWRLVAAIVAVAVLIGVLVNA